MKHSIIDGHYQNQTLCRKTGQALAALSEWTQWVNDTHAAQALYCMNLYQQQSLFFPLISKSCHDEKRYIMHTIIW